MKINVENILENQIYHIYIHIYMLKDKCSLQRFNFRMRCNALIDHWFCMYFRARMTFVIIFSFNIRTIKPKGMVQKDQPSRHQVCLHIPSLWQDGVGVSWLSVLSLPLQAMVSNTGLGGGISWLWICCHI